MCDRVHPCCSGGWDQWFFNQYLHQHAAMTQWIQELHHYSVNSYQGANPGNGYFEPEQREHFSSEWNHTYYSQPCDQSLYDTEQQDVRTAYEANDDYSYKEDETDRDDIIGSDDEIVFDPETIAALRNLKGRRDQSGSDSDDETLSDSDESQSKRSLGDSEVEDFEIIEPSLEKFEYVQLDKFGNMVEDRKGRKGTPDRAKDIKAERQIKKMLYGDRADTLGGLEAAISVDFNRLCDLYQPHLWPVLPARLHC